jgi:hypothetical protein
LPDFLKDNANFAEIFVNRMNSTADKAELLQEAISKYNAYAPTTWAKEYFDEFTGGFNVYHKQHQFARESGGEAEKIVGKLLAKHNGKQVEFLPEGIKKSPDFRFDDKTWDVKFIDHANENTIRTYIKDAQKADNVIFYWSKDKEKLEALRSAINREVGRMRKINKIDRMPDIYCMDRNGFLKLLWKKGK